MKYVEEFLDHKPLVDIFYLNQNQMLKENQYQKENRDLVMENLHQTRLENLNLVYTKVNLMVLFQ